MSALSGAPPPPAATQELPKEAPWVPRMDAIRQANVAEMEAMESVLGAIASNQQSSFIKLRRQVDTIMAWKMKITERERKAAARREATREEAAAAAKKKKMAARCPSAEAAMTAAESVKNIASAEEVVDQNEVESVNLEEDDIDDWGETPEERVEQGMCWSERHTTALTHISADMCVLLLITKIAHRQTISCPWSEPRHVIALTGKIKENESM